MSSGFGLSARKVLIFSQWKLGCMVSLEYLQQDLWKWFPNQDTSLQQPSSIQWWSSLCWQFF
jgi:hypothetical protein